MAIYACSDLHGMLPFYKTVKEMLHPEDKVFFLGDAGDRGPASWETIKAVLNDPQFIYLCGNHESMLIDALEEYIEDGYVSYYMASLLTINGGDETLEEALKDKDMPFWLNRLKKLDYIAEYRRADGKLLILSHAGFTPWKDGDKYLIPTMGELVWDRDHILDIWTDEKCYDCYIIHGHTPTLYLLEDIDPTGKIPHEGGSIWYAGGRKCCIDCGAFFMGEFVLLDLDTFDEEIFTGEFK